jgi:hypothetical protein
MPKAKIVEELNEEEEEILNSGDETDDEEEEDMDFMDMGSLLSSLLTTEDGDNVCTALVKMTMVLQKQMEIQNKILVKILSTMNAEKKES